jgi:hypothetical protein
MVKEKLKTMKTLLNPIMAVLLLSSTILSAQSVDKRYFYDHAAKAKSLLNEIEKFGSVSDRRNSERNLDSTYVHERQEEGLVLVSKIVYAYDQSGRTKTVSQFEFSNGQWLPTLRADLTYSSSPTTVITTIRTMDGETSELVEFAKETKKLRDDGQVFYHELSIFFGVGYLPFEATSITYNSQNLPDTIVSSNMDLEQFALVPGSRETNSYNSAKKIVARQTEFYSVESLEFYLSELAEYVTYDDKGSPLQITHSFWNTVTESWLLINTLDYLYTYDDDQRVTRKTTYSTSLGEETEIYIEEFEYHDTWGEITAYTTSTMSNGILTPLAKETFEFDNEGNLVLETQISLEESPEVILGQQKHFYDGFTSSIGTDKKLVFDIRHANPTHGGDVVQISVETTNIIELTIFDLNGKKVGGKPFQFAETFRLPGLPSGMYILTLQAKGFKPESRKLLIK